ncbi:hypothetical protein SAMN04489761_3129 [Tenacibaculum sp. MAR_2009_124]|uniref:hypothetical protein n=1 Tax=Tenacibaculum sp. MAR_2009_124 TaxID=1250059 RepID=UPI00089D6570|nr:hypothetical protein [Tenacibaculum sp. MAR_2009_124]SEC48717.1 hypothetical protein SAMN04489761_3129 [Tenacibaculum sp. MAR_2009_124]
MSNHKNEEEVDLGSLFLIIGRGFSKFFNFIGRVFTGVFYFFIEILLFFKKNFKKLGIAFVLGAIIGLIVELNEEDRYSSNLLVQTNFNSARQLYSNIEFYNNLVKQNNIKLLAKTFGIDSDEAKTLKKFKVAPIVNGNDVITTYDELVLEIDTATVKSYSFSEFKRTFTKFNYKVHSIEVQSSKDDIFSKLDEVIISSVVKNKYFNRLKELTNENLNRTDALLRKNLAQADSLHDIYKKVLLEEARVSNQGTNIDLGNTQKGDKELELFSTALKINKELKNVSEEKTEKSEIINVISNFQTIGHKIQGVSENKSVQFALLSLSLIILYLLLIKLNKYLENYSRKKV